MKTIMLLLLIAISVNAQNKKLIYYYSGGRTYTTEYVANGSFNTSAANWTPVLSLEVYYSADYLNVGRVNCALDSVTTASGAYYRQRVSDGFTTVPAGTKVEITYKIFCPATNTSCTGVALRIIDGGTNPTIQKTQSIGVWTTVKFDYVATGTGISEIRPSPINSSNVNTVTVGDVFLIDDVSIRAYTE